MSHTDDTDFICVPRISVASQGFNHHRNLDGIYTDVFWGSLKARNLWGKSLMKYGLWPEIIIFKKISTENALEYLAFGKDFIMDRLRLEFLEQREQRINLKIYSLPSREKNNPMVGASVAIAVAIDLALNKK